MPTSEKHDDENLAKLVDMLNDWRTLLDRLIPSVGCSDFCGPQPSVAQLDALHAKLVERRWNNAHR